MDDFALVFKALILGGTALVLLLSFTHLYREEVQDRGEYYSLLLSAALGGMIMASSADLITLFVGLELLSISSYILVGLRKKRTDSGEAAWKYVVLGGVSHFIYGMSFLYGLAGSTNLFVVNSGWVRLMPRVTNPSSISRPLMIVGSASRSPRPSGHVGAGCTRGADAGDWHSDRLQNGGLRFFPHPDRRHLQPFRWECGLRSPVPPADRRGLDDCRQRGGSPADNANGCWPIRARPCGYFSCRWPRGDFPS